MNKIVPASEVSQEEIVSKFGVVKKGEELRWDISLLLPKETTLLFTVVDRALEILGELGFDDEEVLRIIRESKRN